MYNWQLDSWPNFDYSTDTLSPIAVAFAKEFGIAKGLMTGLNEDLKQEILVEILITESIKTSEIEGEYISREDLMSSIKKNLGLKDATIVSNKKAAGIAQLMTTIRQDVMEKLSLEMILQWHQILMEGFPRINAGAWRKGEEPMQIVGGKETIHYEAPPSHRVPDEMKGFLKWFHQDELEAKDEVTKALLKAAIAHLYFESIHPFEDGNGRIGRALAEYTISNTLQSPVLLSLSKTIEKNKKQYYNALKQGQSGLEITEWVGYFAEVILEAQIDAKQVIEFTVRKAKFFDRLKPLFNERQTKAINRMLENGPDGFEGGMTAKKYMAITKTSKATATRDMQHLLELGVFNQIGAGRSVRYEVVIS